MPELLGGRARARSSDAPHDGSPPGRRAWYTSPLIATVVVLALWRLGLAVYLPYDRFIALFDDDAFYYFGIARHIADGDGSTFNGLDPTNGYHPAWLAVIEPAFLSFHGRASLIGVTIAGCLLFIAFGIILEQLAKSFGRPVVLLCSAPVLAVSVVGPSYFFAGMETGLVILAVSATGLLFIRTSGLSEQSATWRTAVALGLLMTASIAARLDSVITMTLLGAVALYRWRRHPGLVLAAAAIPALFLTAYAFANVALFDTYTPVSGQAKALGDATNMSVLVQFLAAPRIFGFDVYLGLIAAPITVAALVARTRRRPDGYEPPAVFGGLLYLGTFCVVVYYGLTSSWQLWPWYFSGIPLAVLFSLIALIGRYGGVRLVSILSVLSTLSVAMLALVWTLDQTVSATSRSAFVSVSPDVAATIDHLDPPDSPIAIGDRAGAIAYHLRRPTVQLEGLVNSKEFLDALKAGTGIAFLNDRGVRLYGRVDASDGDPVVGADGLRRFSEPQQGYGPKIKVTVRDDDLLLNDPLPDGTRYRVWRYRPELNSG